MRQSKAAAVSDSHAMIAKPALAVVHRPDGGVRAAAPDMDGSRAARIRELAYGLYETRGRTDGHDVDDWLAAEAALAGESSASMPPAAEGPVGA
jgi:hypothetical protein